MYFKIEGELDVSQMLSSKGYIDKEKFCSQLLKNKNIITNFYTCSQIEQWEKYYLERHPKQNLNEDILFTSITEDQIKAVFKKFLIPLFANNCSLTIIDPYIFAKNTNISLLVDILSANVQSKKVRFITNYDNKDEDVEKDVKKQLINMDFNVNIKYRSDIHDRYWYTRIKGFFCGTSFNGIGRKTTMLNIFPDQDLNDIINQFGI